MRKYILLIGISSLFLSSCIKHHSSVRNPYCLAIKRKLHLGSHRHTMGNRLVATERAVLMNDAQRYGCDEGETFAPILSHPQHTHATTSSSH